MVETELSWVVSEAMDEPEPPWPAWQSCADFRPVGPSPGSRRTTARMLVESGQQEAFVIDFAG